MLGVYIMATQYIQLTHVDTTPIAHYDAAFARYSHLVALLPKRCLPRSLCCLAILYIFSVPGLAEPLYPKLAFANQTPQLCLIFRPV